MTFSYWSLLFAALLPLIWAAAAKMGSEGYDNHQPRVFLANLTGWPKRANWAQTNAYEAFPPFAAGVIIANQVGANQTAIDSFAIIFLVCRIIHGIAYIADLATFRSLIWTLGYLSTIGLFIAAGWAV